MLRFIVRFIKSAAVLPVDPTVAKLEQEVKDQQELIERIRRRDEFRVRGERLRDTRDEL